jgi:Arc/MetJ family transcription regulator
MRTTVDIDPKLLAEAMRFCAAKTKKGVIHASLAEFVRRRHLEELKAMAGTLDLDLDAEELQRLRADD